MRLSPPHRLNAFGSTARGVVLALAEAKNCTELDEIFAAWIKDLGYQTAGYLRVFGEGQFHGARYLFGRTAPGWAERYQSQQYAIEDPVVTAACRTTGAFTLNEVAAPSPAGAPILADCRTHGLFDGLITPIRSGYDEVGFVLLGTDHLLDLADYERFLLHGICATYARAGLALLPVRPAPQSLTRREIECLRWVAVGRSDPQIGMILGLSPNTVHAHVEAAKKKLDANSRAQLVLRAVMAGILRSDPSRQSA